MGRLVVEPNRMASRAEAAKNGFVQDPLMDCYAYELGMTSPLVCDWMELNRINDALKRVGPYRLCYDWATTGGNATKPGWHLYEVVSRGFNERNDTLKLVFSLQRKADAEWPTGRPCNPGFWVLEELKRRCAIRETQYQEVMARYGRREAEANQRIDDSAQEYEEEAAFIHNTPGLLKKVSRKHRKVKTPKVSVSVPASISSSTEVVRESRGNENTAPGLGI